MRVLVKDLRKGQLVVDSDDNIYYVSKAPEYLRGRWHVELEDCAEQIITMYDNENFWEYK